MLPESRQMILRKNSIGIAVLAQAKVKISSLFVSGVARRAVPPK